MDYMPFASSRRPISSLIKFTTLAGVFVLCSNVLLFRSFQICHTTYAARVSSFFLSVRTSSSASASQLGSSVEALNKKQRNFFWKGRQNANGGSCSVAWRDVCQPVECGGLGIKNIKIFGWSWLQRVDPTRPWAPFRIGCCNQIKAMLQASTITTVGDGLQARFWSDCWLQGQSIAEDAPLVLAAANKRQVKRRSVHEALHQHAWINGIETGLNLQGVVQFLNLADSLSQVELLSGVPDQFTWRWSYSGAFTAKSAYFAFFLGRVQAPLWQQVWECWAPFKCKMFSHPESMLDSGLLGEKSFGSSGCLSPLRPSRRVHLTPSGGLPLLAAALARNFQQGAGSGCITRAGGSAVRTVGAGGGSFGVEYQRL